MIKIIHNNKKLKPSEVSFLQKLTFDELVCRGKKDNEKYHEYMQFHID